jgi:AcrR family transcriptional regulator
MPRAAFTEDQVQAGRARMLAEAQKIVARDGYEALSMRRLADAVDLTPGALYRYFVNKDEVMLALWADELAELNDRLVSIANSQGSHVKAIKAVFTAYAAFAFEDEVRFRTMFMQYYGAAGRDFQASGFGQPAYQAIAKRIADAIEESTFRRVDIDVACQSDHVGRRPRHHRADAHCGRISVREQGDIDHRGDRQLHARPDERSRVSSAGARKRKSANDCDIGRGAAGKD